MKVEDKTKEEPSKELVALHRRIVELEASERKHKGNEDILSRQQEEFQIIMDSVPARIFYKDTENRFVRVNKAFADAIGRSKDQLEGKSNFDISPKDQAEAYWADDKEVMLSGKPKLRIIEPMESAKGKLWVETDKIPYRNAQGNVVGIIGFAIDITERVKSENERLAANQQLRAAIQQLKANEQALQKSEEELRQKLAELNRFNKLMVGRELEMVKLKEQINSLLEELGRPKKYDISGMTKGV
jgi:PAS domain S-box-containing protein